MNGATPPGSFAGLGGNPNLVPSTSGTTTISGISPLTGFGIVASAAMGGGPWQDISNFLGGFGNPIKPSTFEAWGVSRHNIPMSASASGLNFEIPGKGAAGSQYNQIANVLRPVFGSGTKGRWRNAQPFFNMVAAKTKAQIDSDKEILKQAKKGNTSAGSLPGAAVAYGKLTDTSGVFPAAWTSSLERHFKSLQSNTLQPRAKNMARSSLQRSYTSYIRKLQDVSRSTGRNAYMTRQNMERSISSPAAQKALYFKILKQEIANLRGFDFGGASPNAPSQFAGYVGGQPEQLQEQPPAQEQPTREQSLAKNAFKGIGIGSAIVRNVFNPKRLPRPDLGFGQKLFSRQYWG